jgi:beta-lactamase class A
MTAGFPVQAYSASSNLNKLRKQLETIASGFNGKIGVSLHHLKTRTNWTCAAMKSFRLVAPLRLLCLAQRWRKLKEGSLAITQKFSLTEDDVSGGTGFLRNYKIGKQITVKELLHQMITRE